MIAAAVGRTVLPGIGEVLRRAARDFYEESWRLVALNTLLSAYVLAVLAARLVRPGWRSSCSLGAGPLAAALVSAAVIVVESGSLTFVETTRGRPPLLARAGSCSAQRSRSESSRRSWRSASTGAPGTLAWPLAVLVLYLGGDLRPLPARALAARGPGLRAPAARGRRRGGRRSRAPPRRAVAGLGLALLVVNALGVVAAVLPFLTMTIAYSASPRRAS